MSILLALLLLIGSAFASDAASAQHWTYGKGCGGLKLSWEGEPRLNSVVFANLSSPTAFGLGLVTFGWPWPCQKLPACPLDPVCYACIFPVATRPIRTDRYGAFQHPIGIPNDPRLIGLCLALQFWLMNPTGDGCGKPGAIWAVCSSNPGWLIVQA